MSSVEYVLFNLKDGCGPVITVTQNSILISLPQNIGTWLTDTTKIITNNKYPTTVGEENYKFILSEVEKYLKRYIDIVESGG